MLWNTLDQIKSTLDQKRVPKERENSKFWLSLDCVINVLFIDFWVWDGNQIRPWLWMTHNQNSVWLPSWFDYAAFLIVVVSVCMQHGCMLHADLSKWSCLELHLIDLAKWFWSFCPLQHVFNLFYFTTPQSLCHKWLTVLPSPKIFLPWNWQDQKPSFS